MPTIQRRRSSDNNGKQWHFVRSFSVDSIIQIAGIAVVLGLPLLYWGNSIGARVLTLENFNQSALMADTRREIDVRERSSQFNVRIDSMEKKLSELQVSVAQILAVQTVPRPTSPSGRR